MQKLKNKKVIFLIILVLILGVVGIKGAFSSKTKESVMEKKNMYQSVTGNFGRIETTSYFSSESSNVSITTYDSNNTGIIDNVANYSANSDELTDNEIDLHFNTKVIETNVDTMNPGDFVYYVNTTTLFFYDESYADYEIDEINNKVNFYDADNVIGYIKFGSDVPYCAFYGDEGMDFSTCSGEANYYWYYDEYGLIISNGTEVTMADYSVDLIATYAINSDFRLNGSYYVINNELDVMDDGDYAVSYYEDMIAQIISGDTELDIGDISSNQEQKYTEWQSDWGNNIYGKYTNYVVYSFDGEVSYDKSFDVDITLNNNENGNVLLYSNGNQFSGDNVCNSTHTSDDLEVYCSVVVGYNIEEDEDVQFDANVDVSDNINGKSDSKAFTWNVSLGAPGSDVEPTYPTGTSSSITQKNNNLTAGTGAINKLSSGSNVNFGWLIESGTSSINNGFKAFNLWNAKDSDGNYTVSISSDNQELDNKYNETGTVSILNNDDYKITSFYPQNDTEYDYVVSGSTYKLVENVSYDTYSNKDVYVSISDGAYELIGSYITDGTVIAYTANDSRTENNDNVTSENPVVLPDNVTKIKVTYSGDKAAVYLGININVTLLGTSNVKSIIDSLGSNVVYKNVASVQVNSDEIQYNRLGTYLTKLEAKSYANSSSVVNSKLADGKTDSISYTDKFYEQLDYTAETKEMALDLLTEQKTGTVYNLLPSGAELDGNVSVYNIANDTTCTASTEATNNYDGTGRVLLTTTVSDCTSNINDTDSSVQSGFIVKYNVTYSALSNQAYGTELYKDTMYVADVKLGNGYSSPVDANSTLFSDASVKNNFSSLVTGNNNLLFATNKAEVESLSISVGTYDKTVVNNNDSSYATSTSVVESNKYTYKLQYVFTSDLDEITNVVFIDKLENAYEDNDHFNGYLDNVDTSYLTNLGADVTVYYTSNDIDDSEFDVTKWSTEKPDDVKAIAVSCGSYVFKGSDKVSPTVYVTMVAPNEYKEDIKAYNKSNIIYKDLYETDLTNLSTEVTNVTLNEAKVKVTGTSNYGKGSETEPAIIEDSLKYTFTVTNEDTVNSFDNVKVDVTIPDGLKVTNIVSEDGTKTSNTDDSNIITYNVGKLVAAGTKTFELELDYKDAISTDKTFEATYKISNIGEYSYDGTEDKIYNKVLVPNVEGHKYVKTDDVTTFSDTADILVKKEEVFTYRIAVVNDSDKDASNVEVVDTIADGLTVDETTIGTGTISGNKITWNVDVPKNSTVNIDYKVQLNSDAVLGTYYKSSAHVTLVNPTNTSSNLIDEDTNTLSVLYQIASNVKVTNNLDGTLADDTKEFDYTITLSGSSSNAGTYKVYDDDNNALTDLVIDESGNCTYEFTLTNGKSVLIKNLTGGISYTITQKEYEGYTTDNLSVSGTTSEDGTDTYEFNSTYSASGSAKITAKVTYDKTFTNDMFKVDIDDITYDVSSDGTIEEITKTYNNEVGQFTYIIKEVNTGLNKIAYDSNAYKAVVNVTDNKNGTLNTEVKYYDNNDKEVYAVVFENTYLPNGLTIKNVNSSEYIDTDKLFNYEITLTGGEGTYEVKDKNGNKLVSLEFVEGTATYSVNLLSNESILISDLPDGISYTIKQKKVDYYETTANDASSDDDYVVVNGVTVEGSKEISFDNLYETKGSFKPSINVKLDGKDMEDSEFKFKLLDVSGGSTNGYTSNSNNTVDGLVDFDEIIYTKPGTYKYEIVQLDNGSNHIYFDNSKVILTVTLTDNGDGTMEVLGTYEYNNDKEYLLNTYSEEPIVKETVKDDTNVNPNTSDRVRNISILLSIVIVLFMIERWVRSRKFKMNY